MMPLVIRWHHDYCSTFVGDLFWYLIWVEYAPGCCTVWSIVAWSMSGLYHLKPGSKTCWYRDLSIVTSTFPPQSCFAWCRIVDLIASCVLLSWFGASHGRGSAALALSLQECKCNGACSIYLGCLLSSRCVKFSTSCLSTDKGAMRHAFSRALLGATVVVVAGESQQMDGACV